MRGPEPFSRVGRELKCAHKTVLKKGMKVSLAQPREPAYNLSQKPTTQGENHAPRHRPATRLGRRTRPLVAHGVAPGARTGDRPLRARHTTSRETISKVTTPLSWNDLAALAASFPPPGPPKTLHVSERAEQALRRISAPARPAAPGFELAAALTGIPVIPDPDLPAGAWEIRAGDEVISSGVIR